MNLEQQLINMTEMYLVKLKECEDLKRRNTKLRKQFEEAVTQPEKVYFNSADKFFTERVSNNLAEVRLKDKLE